MSNFTQRTLWASLSAAICIAILNADCAPTPAGYIAPVNCIDCPDLIPMRPEYIPEAH
jgi:hypothetical protein